MKKRFLRTILLTGVCMMLLANLFGCKREPEIRGISELRFHFTTSCMANGDVDLRLTAENGEYIAVIKPDGVPQEKAYNVRAQAAVAEEIEALFRAFDVPGWDGFDKSSDGVLDGNSFSFFVRTTDGETISAFGYMEWPENYREVKDELIRIFSALLPKGSDAYLGG